jgi:hypothetical protein
VVEPPRACTVLNDRPVAVTTSGDATVRLWDLREHRELDRIDLPTSVRAIGVGTGERDRRRLRVGPLGPGTNDRTTSVNGQQVVGERGIWNLQCRRWLARSNREQQHLLSIEEVVPN